jgi:predicted DNA-binding transcriptional regulator AlpA
LGKRWLRTPSAAAYCGLAISTLEKMRLAGTGPAFSKAGRRVVVYSVEALDSWLAARTRTSTSDPGEAA